MFSHSVTVILFGVLSLLHRANAYPTHHSVSVRDGVVVEIGPESLRQNCTVERLALQGSVSTMFQLVDGYNNGEEIIPAVMKTIPPTIPNPRNIAIEVENLKKVKQWIWDGVVGDKNIHAIVMKDVNTNFPIKGVSYDLKPFRDWYFLDTQMDVVANLKTLRETVRRVLLEYADDPEISLIHRDFHIDNVFCNDIFTQAVLVDWAPPLDNDPRTPGVRRVDPTQRNAHIALFEKILDQFLPGAYNLGEFGKRLERNDLALRTEDAAKVPEEDHKLQEEVKRIVDARLANSQSTAGG